MGDTVKSSKILIFVTSLYLGWGIGISESIRLNLSLIIYKHLFLFREIG